ncbi:hypothetical protein HDV05_008231, partial [Chytridiales sp. JEL 0842]
MSTRQSTRNRSSSNSSSTSATRKEVNPAAIEEEGKNLPTLPSKLKQRDNKRAKLSKTTKEEEQVPAYMQLEDPEDTTPKEAKEKKKVPVNLSKVFDDDDQDDEKEEVIPEVIEIPDKDGDEILPPEEAGDSDAEFNPARKA